MLPIKTVIFFLFSLLTCICLLLANQGCIESIGMRKQDPSSNHFRVDDIIAGADGMPVSFDQLISDLSRTRIIYIGENHTHPSHHQIQLKIIKHLLEIDSGLRIGIEMVDRTYQPILDLWSSDRLNENQLLEKVHWYANWKYPFDLYRSLFLLVKKNRLVLLGLNIPFHIPPKIATGGVDTLSSDEKKYLPKDIDFGNSAHLAYIRGVFEHHLVPGFENFENFYAAQCVWDETMAETISENLSDSLMVVLAGKGHIIYKFGIPDRAYRRTHAPFRTILLEETGESVELASADYIWFTTER